MEFKVQVDNTFSSQQGNVCVLYIVCVWKKLKSQLIFTTIMDPTALLVLLIDFTVFQLIFTFIYSTFSKKLLVSTK